jgi:hypothetical protein
MVADSVQMLAWASLGLSVLTLLVLAILLVRSKRMAGTIENALEPRFSRTEQAAAKAEQAVRQEFALSRGETENSSKSLREEVGQSFREFSGSILSSFSTLSTAQKEQLDSFSKSLIDWRSAADANAKGLREEVAGTLGKTADAIGMSITQLGNLEAEKLAPSPRPSPS